jgi:Cyclic-phosphate processing Receiver domain
MGAHDPGEVRGMSGRRLKVFVDDLRDAPEGWLWIMTPGEAIDLLKSGEVREISLDHDLGYDEAGDDLAGYQIVAWLEEAVATGEFAFPLPLISIHSANPVGRRNTSGLLPPSRGSRRGAVSERLYLRKATTANVGFYNSAYRAGRHSDTGVGYFLPGWRIGPLAVAIVFGPLIPLIPLILLYVLAKTVWALVSPRVNPAGDALRGASDPPPAYNPEQRHDRLQVRPPLLPGRPDPEQHPLGRPGRCLVAQRAVGVAGLRGRERILGHLRLQPPLHVPPVRLRPSATRGRMPRRP